MSPEIPAPAIDKPGEITEPKQRGVRVYISDGRVFTHELNTPNGEAFTDIQLAANKAERARLLSLDKDYETLYSEFTNLINNGRELFLEKLKATHEKELEDAFNAARQVYSADEGTNSWRFETYTDYKRRKG